MSVREWGRNGREGKGGIGEETRDVGPPSGSKNKPPTPTPTQTHTSLRMYNALVERCFCDCVDSFRRKDLEPTEERCVAKCAEKFMKHSARVGQRFAELSQQAEAQVASMTGKK